MIKLVLEHGLENDKAYHNFLNNEGAESYLYLRIKMLYGVLSITSEQLKIHTTFEIGSNELGSSIASSYTQF